MPASRRTKVPQPPDRLELEPMTGGPPPPVQIAEADAKALERSYSKWIGELGPQCEAEHGLINRTAAGQIRLARCVRAETAALALSVQAVIRAWIHSKQQAVEQIARGLARNPARALARLVVSSYGCDWLIDQWRSLDGHLAEGLLLSDRQRAHLLRLSGYRAAPSVLALDSQRERLHRLARAATTGQLPAGDDDVPDLATVFALLRQWIAERLAELEPLRQTAYDQIDGPELAAQYEIGLIDTTAQGLLRQRYEREVDRSYHKNLSLLFRIRVDRRQADVTDRKIEHAKPKAQPPALDDYPTMHPASDYASYAQDWIDTPERAATQAKYGTTFDPTAPEPVEARQPASEVRRN